MFEAKRLFSIECEKKMLLLVNLLEIQADLLPFPIQFKHFHWRTMQLNQLLGCSLNGYISALIVFELWKSFFFFLANTLIFPWVAWWIVKLYILSLRSCMTCGTCIFCCCDCLKKSPQKEAELSTLLSFFFLSSDQNPTLVFAFFAAVLMFSH